MANGSQVKNGKSFEYALANEYYRKLSSMGLNVELIEDSSLKVDREFYEKFPVEVQNRFRSAAIGTIDTILKIEPGLTAQKDDEDKLTIRLAKDSEGQSGDVRDIIFNRPSSKWEMGFSAKNNNEAVKHSRLSEVLDFGKQWLGVPCSQDYWDEVKPIFKYIDDKIAEDANTEWKSLGDSKDELIYMPLLEAFKKELLKINRENDSIPAKLISYLIGNKPFYKIIKNDSANLVIVKAFNIGGKLNKPVNGVKSRYKVEKINLPTRIVEFDFKKGKGSTTTLIMILDGGWSISFRLHNAETKLVHSLKFDVQLTGNPPVLFSQYLFQD